MQEVVTRSAELFAPAPALERALPGKRRTAAPARLNPLLLWRETIRVFGAHFGSILVYACFGLVGANLVGVVVSTVLLTNAYLIVGGYTAYANILYPQLLIQAVIGLFTFSFARGAITWIVMRGAARPDDSADSGRPGTRAISAGASSVGAAFRVTLRRWPALLAGSLVYGAILTLCTVGLTLLLRDLRLDVTNVGRVNSDVDDMARAIAIRALSGIIPDPGSPFSELQAYVRYTLSRSAYYSWYLYRNMASNAPMPLWLVGLVSVALMVAAETLLRLRAVMAMRAEGPGPLAGLLDSMRMGWRHFGFIAAQVWLLRLGMLAAGVLFTIIPITFVQSIFVPVFARQAGSFWPYPGSMTLFALGSALVGMVLLAFSVVYDTCLYAALQEQARHAPSVLRMARRWAPAGK
ncbi:MAG: hypothetical protein M1546_08560 [Chloroflexi bacterium]|nr:hypothetical protein [Chloroflexota bacterium]